MYAAIRDASIVVTDARGFRIVHLSIQRTHLHLIVEARNRTALSKGMQGFLISAARGINAALSRRARRPQRGCVFGAAAGKGSCVGPSRTCRLRRTRR